MKNARLILIVSMVGTCIVMALVIFFSLAESGMKIGETNLFELWNNEDTKVVFILPVVLVIIAVSLIPFYRIFFPMKIKNGIKTRAKVLEVRDTGVTVNDNPQVGLRLELRTQEGTTLEVEAKSIVSRLSVANVQPGVFANIIYDPLKPQRVQVESFEVDEQASLGESSSDERPPSVTERLLELSDLRARDLVTEAEYQSKRAEILKDL